MVYYGRRYYSPEFGRWQTPDPSGFTDGMNLYSFVQNNSLIHLDEYGLFLISAPTFNFGQTQSLSELFEKIQPIFANPRFQGGMQAISGLSEVSAGAGFAIGSAGWGAPLGFAVTGHGMDHFLAGMKTMIKGSHAETATSQILQKTGLGGQTANLIDNSLSIAGMAKGAAVLRSGQGTFPPKNLTPKVTERRLQNSFSEEFPNNTYPVRRDILNEHLRQWQDYVANGIRKLQNGRIRYYDPLKLAEKKGEMIGRRRVREWDPKTGLKRTWHETLDGNETVRIVRPERNDKIKIHYVFDKNEKFTEVR